MTERSTIQYLKLSELNDLRKYLGALADLKDSKNLSVADHKFYDSNGEAIGKVVFRENQYVFEFDYVEDTDEHE